MLAEPSVREGRKLNPEIAEVHFVFLKSIKILTSQKAFQLY